MTIDWFTFGIQILNFLALIWLMKRFLYGPIINAMDQRQAVIDKRLSDAEAARNAANEQREEYDAKCGELANAREEQLAAAGREVEAWRETHLQKAKAEAQAARTQWQQALVREKQALLREMQLDTASHATDLSRHVLKELASERLQSLMISRFESLLEESDSAQRNLRDAAADSAALLIETSHELLPQDRDSLRAIICRFTEPDIAVDFRVNSQLICGIELRTAGCRLAWSIRDSLVELESDLMESIDEYVPDAAEPQQIHDEVVL